MSKNNKNAVSGGRFALGAIVVLACLTLLTIMILVITMIFCRQCHGAMSAATVNGLILSCVTLSISLSVVVPWMITRTQVRSIAEEAVKQHYDKDFKESLRKTHSKIFKEAANDSRMIAYQLCHDRKPVWALGWICKASCTYVKADAMNLGSTYSTLQKSTIHVLVDCVLQINRKLDQNLPFNVICNHDNYEPANDVAVRTMRDLTKFLSCIDLSSREYKRYFRQGSCAGLTDLLDSALKALLRCFTFYLHCLYGNELKDLLDFNVDNDNSDGCESEYFDGVLKDIRTKNDLQFFIDDFSEAAAELDNLYNAYLTDRCSKI